MNDRLDIVYVGLGHLDAVQWRGTHRIARALAELHRVLFVELDTTINEIAGGHRSWEVLRRPLRRHRDSLYAFTPVFLLPLSRRFPAIGRANERLCLMELAEAIAALGMEHPVLWIDDPWRAHYADAIPHRLLAYNVLHEYAKYAHRITDDPRWARTDGETLPPAEVELLRRADLVFCVYRTVLQRRMRYNEHCVYLPHGVDLEAYARARREAPVPADLAALPRPIVGHLGGVNPDLTDFDLIRHCAERRPDWSFVFIGKHAGGSVIDAARDDAPEARLRLPNVHFLGEKPHSDVPAYVVHFDACWITYALNEFIRDIETMKIYEYLASGKPVLIPRLPQAEPLYDCVSVFDSPEDAVQLLDQALGGGADPKAPLREQAAQQAAYAERARTITQHLRERL